MFDSFVFLPLSITRAYFKGRAYIKIILKNHARSCFAGRSYYRGNTVYTEKSTRAKKTKHINAAEFLHAYEINKIKAIDNTVQRAKKGNSGAMNIV